MPAELPTPLCPFLWCCVLRDSTRLLQIVSALVVGDCCLVLFCCYFFLFHFHLALSTYQSAGHGQIQAPTSASPLGNYTRDINLICETLENKKKFVNEHNLCSFEQKFPVISSTFCLFLTSSSSSWGSNQANPTNQLKC